VSLSERPEGTAAQRRPRAPKDAYPLRAAFAGVLLFVVGLGIAGNLLRVSRQDQERLSGWSRANGTVVELLKRRTAEGDVTVPLIAFTTPSGDRVSFTAATVNAGPPLYVNAPVKVLFRLENPQEAMIDTSSRRWTRNALAGAAAVLLMALGGYVAWYASRWENKSA
jgi:hypothetical protein